MGLLGVSIITCAVLYGLLAIILAAVCIVLEAPLWIAFFVVVAVVLFQYFLSPWITDLTQRWFYKTKFDAEMPAYLEDFIKEVCAEQNMKYPRMGYIDDGAPNAFTYGHTKNDARVVLTRGIFELLSEDEVKAVVAHELGHAVHYDMLLMTMVQVVPMLLYAVYDICMSSKKSSSSSDGDTDYTAIIGIVALILYVICEYIILWLSRVREYYADEFSAQVTKDANALASALVNIGFGLSTREKSEDAKGSVSGQSTLGIFDSKNSKSLVVECYKDGEIDKSRIKNAMKWELWNTWAFWYELSSTHPLTSKRLIRLGKLAEEAGMEPFVNFDLVKPESYVDDFLRECAVAILPWVGFLAFGIAAAINFISTDGEGKLWLILAACALVAGFALSCVKYLFTHPRKDYHEANTAGLLGEVKVSMIRSIPAELKGTIIGRGNPGCIFDENFVLRDETGIIFLDYNQPLWLVNKIFALFKSPEYFDKEVTVKGWYRRNMVPFFELYSMEIDGKLKKCYSYGFGWGWRIALLVLSLAALVVVAFML